MSSSNQPIQLLLHYHQQMKDICISIGQANMVEIHQYIRSLFGHELPPYHIKIYDTDKADFINLSQNELDYGYNPFIRNTQDPVNFVELYLVSLSNNIQTNIPINVPSQDRVTMEHNCRPRCTVNENECQEDTPVLINTNGTNLGSTSSSLSVTQCNANNLLDNGTTLTYGLLDHQWDPMVLFGDAQSDPNEHESIVFSQNRLPPPLQIAPVGQNLTRPIQVENKESNRLKFTLDVKPVQKKIYKSDQFNQKNKNKKNGYITRIQGIKTGKPKRSSVLPKIRIPLKYRNKSNIKVDVYSVTEKLRNGKRHWLKNRDKGFLPKGYQHNTSPVNPISFPLKKTDLTPEGDYKLNLPMTSMWNKSDSSEEEEVYQLDENEAKELHGIGGESSTRLLTVLREDTTTLWKTAGLSDYIRQPVKTRR